MGGASILPTDTRAGLAGLFRYSAAVPNLDFARLIWKYRRELSAVDRHFSAHGRPDVIAALQSCEDAGILAFLIGRRYQIPYVVMEHKTYCQRGLMDGSRLRVFRRVVESAHVLLTVSPQLGESVRKALNVKLPHLETMPNPLPEEFFQPYSGAPDWLRKFAGDKFVFAGWTKWRAIKRVDLALEAFRRLWLEEPRSCLVIAGWAPAGARTMARELGIAGAVRFTGPLGREEIKKLAYNCDCCIVTSDHETFGLPVIEAMAAGKPAVATRCGGPESIIGDAAYGRIVEPGDSEAFSEAMLDVLQNRDRFDSRAIRSYCRERYSENSLLGAWEDVYKKIRGAGDESFAKI